MWLQCGTAPERAEDRRCLVGFQGAWDGSLLPVEFEGARENRRPSHVLFCASSTGCIFTAKPLTMQAAEAYITRSGAPPLGAMTRLRAPHCFAVIEHPAMIVWPCRMCGLRRLRRLPETGLEGSGLFDR